RVRCLSRAPRQWAPGLPARRRSRKFLPGNGHRADGSVSPMLERELGLQGNVFGVAGGGGGGIGTAICRRLIEAGASVAALDIDAGKLALAEEAMKTASAGGGAD